ncbi:16S rRNA-processing protein RimM [Acetobacter aceti NRIC 0242]|uniref:ribosome maturation factor RimM n=1 Tax=Acetobacter aceti TaxID=435 RepID=UPI00022608CD|nr:ribosome maturation factor RimM [Acetobacter aceti]TCS28524.1 16S rRNA processing protein RimM [Acetobacter aceti NBRC 14818]GAN58243.1 ribosomal RNA 16S processing protein RimM [Acetobacter aceti NBRC 14818]GBO81587.1 16S rRNA-processing protein RimM [Acetobacter aceti NRIC 0242]
MTDERIQIGVIGRPHGVRGLVHVHSYATDEDSLVSYGVLTDDRGDRWTLNWRSGGVAELRDAQGKPLADRTAAQALVNRKLYVSRDVLPEPDEDEFYHSDLLGLDAVEEGASIGKVVTVHDYGAGTSLELDTGLILPFSKACVPEIDFPNRRMIVVRPVEVIGEEEHAPKEKVTKGASA